MSNLLGLEGERPSTGEYDHVTAGPDARWVVNAKRGANWFYWIAGLSVINSAAFIAGAHVHFLAGLGLTEIADAVVDLSIRQGSSPSMKVVAVVFDLIVVISFALAGYFANKLVRTAFLLGIIVYAIDALIVLALGDYFMAAFHAFALYSLIVGYIACRSLKSHRAVQVSTLPPPPPPPESA